MNLGSPLGPIKIADDFVSAFIHEVQWRNIKHVDDEFIKMGHRGHAECFQTLGPPIKFTFINCSILCMSTGYMN